MKNLKRVVSILLAAIGIPFLIYRCLVFASSIFTFKIYLGSVTGELLAVVILFILFAFTGKGLYKRCNFKKVKGRKLSVIGLVMIGFNFLALIFINYAQNLTTSYQGAETAMHNAWFSPLEIIGAILLVPIFEEILFRGAVFSVLKNNMNIYLAVLVQGVVFAFMHSIGGGIIQASYTFILGLLLLFASYYADSMLGDIFGHIVFNLFGLIIMPIIQVIYYNTIVYALLGIVFILVAGILYKKDIKSEKFKIE